MKSLAATAAHWFSSPIVRRWLQVIVTGLVIFFFGLALFDIIPRVLAYPWNFQPVYLAFAFILLIVRGPVPVYGWWAILKRLGYILAWRAATRTLYYSAMAGYLPGSVWHAVSRVYLAEKEGVPKTITTVSVVLESVLILLAALVLAAITLIAWPDPPLWAAAIGLIILVGIIWRPDLAFKVANWGLQRFGRKPLDITLSPADMVRLLWPFILNWIIFGVMFYAILASIYPSLSPIYIPLVAGIFTAAWVGGYLAIFVPQGLGVRELIIVTLLAVIGVPAPVATAAALIARLWSIIGVGIWGAIATRL